MPRVTHLIEHKVELIEKERVKQKPYPTPYKMQEVVDNSTSVRHGYVFQTVRRCRCYIVEVEHTHTHTRTHTPFLTAIIPGEPGLAGCPLNSPSPFVPGLHIFLGEA